MNVDLAGVIAGPAGRLEARWDLPAGTPHAVAVLAHPHPEYGGTMHTKMVYHASRGLVDVGCAVLRFNFRGVGTSAGAFDQGKGEADDFLAAVEAAADQFPGRPLWAAGGSFGSWIAATVGARDSRVSLLLLIATPAGHYEFDALVTCTKPKFFVHGEHDEVAPLGRVRALYARVPEPREIAVIDAANHQFDGHASQIADAIGELLGDWKGQL
jgi:alpha/beta superfamily hydrolase